MKIEARVSSCVEMKMMMWQHVIGSNSLFTNTKKRYNVTPITSAKKKSNVKNDRWHFCKLSDFFNVCLFQVRRKLTFVCSRSDVI